jgi:hypothetical protein
MAPQTIAEEKQILLRGIRKGVRDARRECKRAGHSFPVCAQTG